MTNTDPEGRSAPADRHRIVVGVDGSEPAKDAVAWAARQALVAGAVLELHAAFGTGYVLMTPSKLDEALTRVLDDALERAVEVAPGVATARRTHAGTPQRALVEESDGADLLVVGSRGRGGFSGLLLGSVSRYCVHRSRCPVVVVRHDETGAPTRTAPAAPGKIVVGVDGSPSSLAALEWALGQADRTSSPVEVITTWEWPVSFGVPFVFPSDLDPAKDSHTVLDGALDKVGVPSGVSCRRLVVEGHPALSLVDASREADLLVVGSRGRGEVGSTLLGSVSEQCVTRAHCPVLVMHDGN